MLLNRRNILGLCGLGLVCGFHSLASNKIVPTPRQMKGPFYPEEIPLDSDNDLIRVRGKRGIATGQITNLMGTLYGSNGLPIPNARLEIWQCNAFGSYTHAEDGGNQDPFFQGFGKTVTDSYGRYRFKTIKPVAYPGRSPHIHMRIVTAHSELFTQIYVQGEPSNNRDFLLNMIGESSARESLIIPFESEVGRLNNEIVARFNPVVLV